MGTLVLLFVYVENLLLSVFSLTVFDFTPRTAKMEPLRKRRSRRKMGRRKKKEEKSKKAREKGTKRTQRWVRNGQRRTEKQSAPQRMKELNSSPPPLCR